MGNENLNYIKMIDFNIDNFDINNTDKYYSCSVEGNPISSSDLTKIFENGWKLISYNGYSKNKFICGEHTSVDVFTYMFENLNYDKIERV